MPCPDANQIAAFLGGTLDPDVAQELAGHLDACSTCNEIVAWSVRAGESASGAEGEETPEPDGPAPRPPGSVFGRYVLLDLVGAGGMGMVYAAFDPRLDRKVALKLVWDEAPVARARVEREARLAARLQHPNVIAIHDVGVVDDRIYIAMEYVDGLTLAQWIRGQARPHRDILAVFLQAARGLAAAHGAGLVHRDFKPSNVLVGNDGRVRVLDFGLARAVNDAPASLAVHGRASVTIDVSGTGVRAGSPAYMAPEQHRGDATDAAADQFAFCVALHEALYGARPFAGATEEELVANVLAGRVDEPSRGARVPPRLRRVIQRGLRVDPRERFPSMDALASALGHELGRDSTTRLRSVLLVAATVIAVGASALIWQRTRPAPCRAPSSELAGAWDPSVKAGVHDAFRATGHPFAEPAFTAVAAALDAYAASISAGVLDTCNASQVTGEQSDAVRDLRVRCLDKRRQVLRALAFELERVDADGVLGALRAARGLPEVADCNDVEALSSPTPLPRDPALRIRIEALGPLLAEAKALNALGRFRPALPLLATGVALAQATGYQPLIAELLVNLGQAREDAGDLSGAETAVVAATAAALAGRVEPVAIAALERLVILAGRADRYEAAAWWADLAWATVQRIGAEHAALGGTVSLARARIAARLSRFGEARVLTLEALHRFEEQYGRTDVRLVRPLLDLGVDTGNLGAFDEARSYTERAIAILVLSGGGEAPDRAEAEAFLGFLAYRQGRNADARAIAERALAMAERIYGKDTMGVTKFMMPLAYINESLGRDGEALALFRRVRSITTMKLAEDNDSVLAPRIGIAAIMAKRGELAAAADEYEAILAVLDRKGEQASQGALLAQALMELTKVRLQQLRLEDAERVGRRALATLERVFGKDHENDSVPLVLLADVALRRGQAAKAHELVKKGLAILERSANPELLADALCVSGRLELVGGRATQARAALERARGLREQSPSTDGALAQIEVPLAQALWQSGEPRQARALALAARDALRAHHPTEERDLVELLTGAEALLARRER